MTREPHRSPGDFLLDRYLPGASSDEREHARTKLQEYARWLLEVAMEQVRAERQLTDSRDPEVGDTMEMTSPPP